MFSPEQIEQLKAPLSREVVKKNPRGYDYVEAYHAENEANRIFGFSEWDRYTYPEFIDCREVDGKFRVYYRAKVRIVVRHEGGETVREGCGYGSGIDKDLGAAHEGALKEAESDAEKRALKTFGNPFGQALYDKDKSQVADAPPAALAASKASIDVCADLAALRQWRQDNGAMLNELPSDTATEIVRYFNARVETLKPKAVNG